MQLHLEEQSPSLNPAGDPLLVELYADGFTQFNHAVCISKTQCPVSGVSGWIGRSKLTLEAEKEFVVTTLVVGLLND